MASQENPQQPQPFLLNLNLERPPVDPFAVAHKPQKSVPAPVEQSARPNVGIEDSNDEEGGGCFDFDDLAAVCEDYELRLSAAHKKQAEAERAKAESDQLRAEAEQRRAELEAQRIEADRRKANAERGAEEIQAKFNYAMQCLTRLEREVTELKGFLEGVAEQPAVEQPTPRQQVRPVVAAPQSQVAQPAQAFAPPVRRVQPPQQKTGTDDGKARRRMRFMR